MKFFMDTANVEAIRKYAALGMVDGITTNPTIIARSGRNHEQVIRDISAAIAGPVSVEGIGQTAEEIVKEAEVFSKWGNNIVIKVAMNEEGLRAVRILSGKGLKTNVTLVFSASQALLAAKAGATYVSPFVGRLDDAGVDGMQLIRDIMDIYKNYGFKTEVIVASVRSTKHVEEAAKAGAHIATIPDKVFAEMWKHPLTDKGIAQFLDDHARSKSNK